MSVRMNRPQGRRWAAVGRIVAFVLVAATLSGCVIVPYGHYHHW